MNKPNFEKILKKHQTHSTFFDEKYILNALEECYNLGLKQSEGENKQLKKTFKSLLDEYVYKVKTQKSTNLLIEEWEKKAGIY